MRILYLTVPLLAACALLAVYPDARTGTPVVLLRAENHTCSAVFVAPTVAYTAAHCLRDAALVTVAARRVVAARVSEHADLARVRVAIPWHGPVAEIDPTIPAAGDVLTLRGYGSACAQFARPVVYRHRALFPVESPDLVFGGRACHGDSGGGVFDRDGRLRAIVWGTRTRAREVVAVPLASAFGAWR